MRLESDLPNEMLVSVISEANGDLGSEGVECSRMFNSFALIILFKFAASPLLELERRFFVNTFILTKDIRAQILRKLNYILCHSNSQVLSMAIIALSLP